MLQHHPPPMPCRNYPCILMCVILIGSWESFVLGRMMSGGMCCRRRTVHKLGLHVRAEKPSFDHRCYCIAVGCTILGIGQKAPLRPMKEFWTGIFAYCFESLIF